MEKQTADPLSFVANQVAKIFSGKLGFYTRETQVVVVIDTELGNKTHPSRLTKGR